MQKPIRDISLIICAILCAINSLWAVPAKPGLITAEQADGTQIKLYVKGDEFFKWRTTESGYPIAKGDDGFYYYASYQSSGKMEMTNRRVSINGVMQSPLAGVSPAQMVNVASRAGAIQRATMQGITTRSGNNSSSGFPSQGKVRSAVILVEYTDVKFTLSNPNQAFHDQLNLEGYSVAGATGSARDYFTANSKGQFDGEFDVYGPYTLSRERSYYGANKKSNGVDIRPDTMVMEAVQLADAAGVDFSQYDLDEDGLIDNIFVYYAGHNEAESQIDDTVWPHKWVVAAQPIFDNKKLFVYACTSELRGKSGSTIAGIGTFCHEFSHVFGLADHYDTDEDKNGLCYGLGFYDIMTYGSYNNDGNTPPMMNALELSMIGWESPTLLDSSQELTIDPIGRGEVYKVPTEVDGEYFLIENRNSKDNVWDSYIANSGLFITHVDMSDDYINRWRANAPNSNSTHECFRYIVAGNTPLDYKTENKVPYPYQQNNKWNASSAPAARSWAGEELKISISNITRNNDGSVSMSVIADERLEITGKVNDQSGEAVEGATINFYPLTEPAEQEEYTTTTDSQGAYSQSLYSGQYKVKISCPFYLSSNEIIEVSNTESTINFELKSIGSTTRELSIAPEQSQATLTWNPQKHNKFLVTIDSEEVATLNDAQYVVTGLTPDTTYDASVCAITAAGECIELYNAEFTTIAKRNDIPIILLDRYNISCDETIELKLLNTTKDDVVSWQIDNTPTPLTHVKFTPGRHTIQASVVRGKRTYRVNKTIIAE